VVLEALVSAVLLAAILQWAGIHQVLHELSRTQLRWFVPAVLVSIATVPLMAFRWRLLLSAKRIDVPIAWLTRTYFVALFAGQRNVYCQTPQIFDERQSQGDGDGPQLADR